MNGQRTLHALLFVIALCLVLIVVKLYGGDLVTQASADTQPPHPTPALLYGCTQTGQDEHCGGQWKPLLVDGTGTLVQRK